MWPKPVGTIPVLVGGDSRAALARTVRLGDGWYGSDLSPDRVGEVANALTAMMKEAGALGRLTLGTRAADVEPGRARHTVEAFRSAGADFVILDAVHTSVGRAVDWIHRTADALDLDPDIASPLVIARAWAGQP